VLTQEHEADICYCLLHGKPLAQPLVFPSTSRPPATSSNYCLWYLGRKLKQGRVQPRTIQSGEEYSPVECKTFIPLSLGVQNLLMFYMDGVGLRGKK